MTSTDREPHDGRHHYTEAELHNPDVAHEEADVNIRTVLTFAVGLAIVVMIAAGLMGILFHVLSNQAAARDPQVSPLATPSGQPPPAPRLLTNEPGNLTKFRAEETQKLEGYGWVDQTAGIARVPIAEAKKLLVQRGLPVRASGAVEDPRTGTHAPAYGEASGGRTIAMPKAPGAAPTAPPAPAAAAPRDKG